MSKPQSSAALFDLFETFKELINSKTYQYDEANMPTDETFDQIERLSLVHKLCYGLFAKPYKLEYHGHQRSSVIENPNPRPNKFSIGPFVVEFTADPELNTWDLSEISLPRFDEINKINMNEDQFISRYGKVLNEDVLERVKRQANASTTYEPSKPAFNNESEMMSVIQHHWFEPIRSLLESYNKLKRPTFEQDVVNEYISYINKMGNVYRVHDNERFGRVEFEKSHKTSFKSFNTRAKADLAFDFYFKDINGDASAINFMLILEGKVPTTNVLQYLKSRLDYENVMWGSSNDTDKETAGGFTETGKEDFNTCFSKVLSLLIRSNSNKAIITDYNQVFFMDIQIENGEMVLYYSMIDSSVTERFRYILFSFISTGDYEQERLNRNKIQDYVLRKLSENENREGNQDLGPDHQFWNSGVDTAKTTRTTTTDFSLSGYTGEINYEPYRTLNTAQLDFANYRNLKEGVKIFGQYPYHPDEIARKFQMINTVLFDYDPKIISYSLHEIIEVSSDLLQDLGYDMSSDELSTIGPKVIIKLAPLESLFVEFDNEDNNDSSYDDGTGGLGDSSFNQNLVDSIYGELKIHLKVLQNYNDSFVVRIFHYGYLNDRTKFVNTKKLLNWRFNGPMIMLEKIKNIQHQTLEELKCLKVDIKEKIIQNFQLLHNINVIHNDVKPSNLYVSPDGDVKILDFGNSYESDKESDKMKEMSVVRFMLGI